MGNKPDRMIEVREDGVLLFKYDPSTRIVELSALLRSRRRELVRIDLSAYDAIGERDLTKSVSSV